MISRVGLVAALLSLPLAGCGGGDSADAQPQQADGPAETWPSCADVWVTGKTLPQGYEGCVIKGSSVAPFTEEPCDSGHEYGTYQRKWYAVRGGVIHEATTDNPFMDKAFTKFVQTC